MELKEPSATWWISAPFVDIGVKQGWPAAQIADTAWATLLKVGDIIDLEILKIEPERGRISLGWASSRDKRARRSHKLRRLGFRPRNRFYFYTIRNIICQPFGVIGSSGCPCTHLPQPSGQPSTVTRSTRARHRWELVSPLRYARRVNAVRLFPPKAGRALAWPVPVAGTAPADAPARNAPF